MQEYRRDKIIAAAVTLLVALLIMLILIFGYLSFDKMQLAHAENEPQIQTEELFVEPEILEDLGEVNATEHDEPAPALQGTPAESEQENTKLVVPDKNPKPAPQVEKPITQPKESNVKATTPPMSDEEKKKVTSKVANKFSPNNGTESGKTGSSGAGGAGVGVSGNVSGRTFKGCPKPSVALQNKVVVRVNLSVDANGRVVPGSTSTRLVSGQDPSGSIRKACEKAALQARWNEDKDTPSARGSITFTITPR